MVEKLFISKVRIKLLKIFLEKPEEEHHVRKLVRMTEEEINAVRRELKNLENVGLLISQPKLNKLVYRINNYCPFIPELRNLLRKDSNIARMLVDLAKSLPKISVVILTSNYLTGDERNKMDVDVLFIGNPDIPTLTAKMSEIEKEESKQVRYTIISDEDFAFRKKNRDSFLLNIINSDKILLVGKEADLII